MSRSQGSIAVAVIDDHPVVLHGLESLIEAEVDMRVVATARDGNEAVTRVAATRPDVVVMDVRMPGCDGVEATRRILQAMPDVKVILLSVEDGPILVDGLEAGAVGVLSKRSVAQTLVDGIREAASGRPVVSPTLVGSLVGTLRDSRTANPLSPRERQILALVADGRTNDQIGRELRTSISTVKALLAGTFAKLGAHDRASALAVCFRRGWIT